MNHTETCGQVQIRWLGQETGHNERPPVPSAAPAARLPSPLLRRSTRRSSLSEKLPRKGVRRGAQCQLKKARRPSPRASPNDPSAANADEAPLRQRNGGRSRSCCKTRASRRHLFDFSTPSTFSILVYTCRSSVLLESSLRDEFPARRRAEPQFTERGEAGRFATASWPRAQGIRNLPPVSRTGWQGSAAPPEGGNDEPAERRAATTPAPGESLRRG